MQSAPPRLVLLPLLVVSTAGLFVLALAEPRFLFAAIGLGLTTIVAVPALLDRRFDWFSPWSFLLLSVAFGGGLRGLAMTAGWPDAAKIDELLVCGAAPADFLRPNLLAAAGLGLLAVGYFVFGAGVSRRRTPRFEVKSGPRFRAGLCLLVLISAGSVLGYIHLTGGLESGVLSAKRASIDTIDVAGNTDVAQHGPLLHAARLAVFSLLLVVAVPLARRRSGGWMAVAGLLLLLGLVLPFYCSQRLPVMWACVSLAATVTYVGGRLPVVKIATLGAATLAVYFVMTQLRASGEVGDASITERVDGLGAVESFASNLVVHRNFFGLSKTAHIINSVPSTLPYEGGRTIAVWAVANVPRSLWPGKPLIHSGPIIGTRVYGNRISGVPPGLLAELYWNFGLAGVLAGCPVLGFLLRWLYEAIDPRCGRPAAVLMYVVGPMQLAFDASGNSLGYGLNTVLLNGVTMAGILLMVGRRTRRTSHVGAELAGPGGSRPVRSPTACRSAPTLRTRTGNESPVAV